jgi:SAM-dependent methyltransferase
MVSDVFTRDDGRTLRIVPGFRDRVLGYRASATPRPGWDEARYAAAAEKHIRRFGRLLDSLRRWRPAGLEGAALLDVGCGGGINCLLAAATQPVDQVVGVDLELQLPNDRPEFEPARRLAERVLRKHVPGLCLRDALPRLPLRFERMDARAMNFPDASFDVLLSRSAMEHLKPLDAALREMARVVRPGGVVHHAIDPFHWLRGCHKRGVVDIPWAHARLTLDEYERFVRAREGPAKAAERRRRLETLNALGAEQWREAIESGPFDVLAWELEPSDFARDVLSEHPDVVETLLPNVSRADLTCGRITAWLRRT